MTDSRQAAIQEKTLSSLSPALRSLAKRGTLRSYPKSTIIVSEGDIGDTLFVLIKGLVRVFSSDLEGREITFGHIHASDYFGEMSLDGGPRSASVVTLESCTCAVVTRAAVRDHLDQEPGFAMDLVAQVIRRARNATESARSMALMDVYGRVSALLESYGGPGSPEQPVEITGITHQDMASRVGASREMVSRLLKDLEKGGYIQLGIKRLTLLNKLPANW